MFLVVFIGLLNKRLQVRRILFGILNTIAILASLAALCAFVIAMSGCAGATMKLNPDRPGVVWEIK